LLLKKGLPSIYFTVTTDLSYDQRMIRICTSLAQAGYSVKLVGRQLRSSITLTQQPFAQKRLRVFFQTGKLSYIEYHTRLFFYLLFKKMDAICAIDLDTIVPCYYISRIKNIPRILDAHEYFSQMKEVITRPWIYKIWHWVERKFLPAFPNGYTVSASIAAAYKKLYHVDYGLIRNIPLLTTTAPAPHREKKIIIYQGAVNEGRGFEYLVPAMKMVPAELHIYGDGNYAHILEKDIMRHNTQDKVFMKGKLTPPLLREVTSQAYIGINLGDGFGLNHLYSLANKFFDYIHFAVPQVTMNFPEYAAINETYDIALLVDDLEPVQLAATINRLLNDDTLYRQLQQHCIRARLELNWQEEEKKLLRFYSKIFAA
jgi:glycosyltransferase involved in cell wall biosynthesis